MLVPWRSTRPSTPTPRPHPLPPPHDAQVLKLGQRRQKEVRLITLAGPAGVGKSSLAIAAASHLFERRWFPEGCVRVELGGCDTETSALAALTEALDMELTTYSDIGRAMKHWRGLLVLDECDAASESGVMATLLFKLLSTQVHADSPSRARVATWHARAARPGVCTRGCVACACGACAWLTAPPPSALSAPCPRSSHASSHFSPLTAVAQELRVLCTARAPIHVPGEVVFSTTPLHRRDAARLFKELAMESLPPALRREATLMDHPVQ